MTNAFSISGTPEQRAALLKMVRDDDSLYDGARDLIVQAEFLSRNSKNVCFASNAYFAKYLNKSVRTVSRYISQLVKAGYLCINLIWKDGRVDKRIIALNIAKLKEHIVNKVKTAAEILNRNVKTTTREFFRLVNNGFSSENTCNSERNNSSASQKPHSNANVYTYDVDKGFKVSDTKEKDDLLLRNKSQKEKVLKRSRPENYDEVLKLWTDKNLEGTARAFWRYNTKRAWADIRNWKRAAIGWVRKAKDNLAAFKANKTKNKQTTTNYNSILPDLSYNNWDIL